MFLAIRIVLLKEVPHTSELSLEAELFFSFFDRATEVWREALFLAVLYFMFSKLL